MGLFRKKCEYCGKKIDKGNEIFRTVKIPGFIGTKEKVFCCSEHAEYYEKELEKYMKKPRKAGKSCCG